MKAPGDAVSYGKGETFEPVTGSSLHTDHHQEILRLRTLEQQARIMASKSPFPADRERFLAVADSYGTRAQGLSTEVIPVVGHSRPQPSDAEDDVPS